jgi:hypothetical protein
MKVLKLAMVMFMSANLLALSGRSGVGQSSSASNLPWVGKPRMIGLLYTRDGRGKILMADETGKVQQSLELWEDHSRVPNVISYMLVSLQLESFSVTWGRGPVNRAAFACSVDKAPVFSEKTIWVATAANGILSFQEIKDSDVKALFQDLNQARLRADRNATRGLAGVFEQNIMIFVKEKNRKKWLERGWLTPTNTCVRHF